MEDSRDCTGTCFPNAGEAGGTMVRRQNGLQSCRMNVADSSSESPVLHFILTTLREIRLRGRVTGPRKSGSFIFSQPTTTFYPKVKLAGRAGGRAGR